MDRVCWRVLRGQLWRALRHMSRGLDSIRWYSEPWGEVESAEGGRDLGAWCLSTGDPGEMILH